MTRCYLNHDRTPSGECVGCLKDEIDRLRAWAEDEQRRRHKAEEDRMNARSEVERMRAETAWLQRLLTWCRARLRREEYKGALDRYLAAGPTDVDDTKMTNAALTGGKE